jgi:membrane-bound lytic murein transglycosylase D
MIRDGRTEGIPVPAVKVHVDLNDGRTVDGEFDRDFTIGRGDDCELKVDSPYVSSHHCAVQWEGGQWWIQDLGSKNGTYIDGTSIERATLHASTTVQLALAGPVALFSLEQKRLDAGPVAAGRPGEMTRLVQRYFGAGEGEQMGVHTRLVRQAFQKVQKKQRFKYRIIIAVAGVLLLITAAALYYQSRRVAQLEKLHAMAEEIFYTMKSLELQVSRLEAVIEQTSDVRLRKDLTDKKAEQQTLQANYSTFSRDELGISKEKLSEQDWIIYKVARLFGECDVNMPPDFVTKVKEYIRRWQSTATYRTAITRAIERGYPSFIKETMTAHGMAPQFFYLALQESKFDPEICGPQTRSGYAKGMWQFIPATAWHYGLRTGPLVDVGKTDQFDERHDFQKSTRAAARYLRDLYETEAQASGLLVMACYNWREDRIVKIVRSMPENPRDRNFWNLLKMAKVPEETYNYVFYIIAAAAIGENPRLFGFEFDNPLASAGGSGNDVTQ